MILNFMLICFLSANLQDKFGVKFKEKWAFLIRPMNERMLFKNWLTSLMETVFGVWLGGSYGKKGTTEYSKKNAETGRGIDTRLNFTDYLYEALVSENIYTFLDEQEVETGEELKPELTRAIKGSRASIIVLSKNYASSTWCLDELVLILEQRKVSKHIVVPIFYHVEPTHVRKQESSFGEALFKHKQRMEAEQDEEKKSQAARKLELWTAALKEVADLKGKDVNGREKEFIEEIVKEISSRLDIHMKNRIPHLIGRDGFLDTIWSWFKGGSSDTTEILTIWGMAGIGKTSLAKHIYLLHRHEFERSSFVEDIERRGQQSSALLLLQNKLLGDILKKGKIEEDDVQNCTSKIETALLHKRTLVVLDGVDNFQQVHVLVGREGFHPGSRIIITTKDGSITDKALLLIKHPPKHTKLALDGLRSTDSLRLFCWHAFGGYSPKEGYEEDAIRASKYCGGHPLALIVLGSSLLNEDADTWSHTFTMLESREFQINNVHKVLRIGFDSLPSDCKELFKHIACFFVGKETEVTEAILKDCGVHLSYGVKKLIERCLLTIGLGKELKMHQLLQDMGRDIVRQESLHEPWNRSRVWNHEESLNILQEDKGTAKIQGLLFDMKMLKKETLLCGSSSATDHEFEDIDLNMNFGVGPLFSTRLEFSSSSSRKIELITNALNRMEKLILLQLNHVKLNGPFKNFPKGLRGLCMHGFQSEYIPSDLPMDHLVALDMSFSDLKKLWRKPKLLGSLKYLNLSYSKLVTIGGFKELPALERLILARCESLTHVCESIGECGSLVVLNLSYCSKLKNLPIIIRKVKNVKVLTLDGCRAGVFDKERKRMKLLNVPNKDGVWTKLQAFFSSNTRLVPNSQKLISLSLPSSLVTLSLTDNNISSESFPVDFSSMSMLKNLYLDCNPIDSIPDCLKSLGRLKVLSVGGCSMLKLVICPSSTIKRLYVDGCELLEKVTFYQEMSAPPLICCDKVVSLTEIEGILKIQDLAQVDNEIISSLGWTDIHYVKDYEVMSFNYLVGLSSSKKLPIKMCYEFGIFSTYFPGKEVPKWFGHRSNGRSISFTMPSASANKRIEGINICLVHALSFVCLSCRKSIKVKNITKDRSWEYYSCLGAKGHFGEEGIVWLSHWMFENNELEAGDQVSVTIENRYEYDPEAADQVSECGISLVYSDKDKEGVDPLSHYKSWKHIIGRDLSAFQTTSRNYFLSNWQVSSNRYRFKRLFYSETRFKKSFDHIPLPEYPLT
ncbi:toll/interleukin-1 receptor (TIR) domain-containing protein [Artemisia annua]|uniref:ADP-ribosyl cyclase/cyclic ADP-ribose hydrolase n=1 Tax=Artemisia annua TaxID=35608 RepID=A0A2U1M6M4_ARTAN|nr:toll/interleukin-1 receptor (TIR) domain-containing protein [Artemisia annua]